QRDGLAVLLRGNRAEQRAVRGVDERVRVLEDRLQLAEVAAAVDRTSLAEAHRREDRSDDDDDECEGGELAAAAGARLAALPAPIGDNCARPATRPVRGRRAHSSFFSRKPLAMRRRRSLSTCSSCAASGAQARTVTVAAPFRAVTSTSKRGSPAVSVCSKSTTASRSLSRGTW